MACNRCGPRTRTRDVRRAAPAKARHVAPAAPPADKRFCHLCKWLVRKVRHRDVRSGMMIERESCTNRKCPNYRR